MAKDPKDADIVMTAGLSDLQYVEGLKLLEQKAADWAKRIEKLSASLAAQEAKSDRLKTERAKNTNAEMIKILGLRLEHAVAQSKAIDNLETASEGKRQKAALSAYRERQKIIEASNKAKLDDELETDKAIIRSAEGRVKAHLDIEGAKARADEANAKNRTQAFLDIERARLLVGEDNEKRRLKSAQDTDRERISSARKMDQALLDSEKSKMDVTAANDKARIDRQKAKDLLDLQMDEARLNVELANEKERVRVAKEAERERLRISKEGDKLKREETRRTREEQNHQTKDINKTERERLASIRRVHNEEGSLISARRKMMSSALISGGFALMGSGLPGGTQLGSIAIGGGFGQGPGAAAAAGGVALTAMVRLSQLLVTTWVDLGKKAFEVTNRLQEQELAMQAMLATTLRFSDDVNKNFQMAGEYTEDLNRKIIDQSILYSGNSKELRQAYNAFLTGGGLVLVQNEKINEGLDKSVKIVRLLAETIKQQNKGRPMAAQIPGEIEAFLQGRSKNTDSLSIQVFGRANTTQYKTNREAYEQAVKMGTAYEFLEKRLSGFALAAEKFGKEQGALVESVNDIVEQITRAGFKETADYIKKKEAEIVQLLQTHKGDLIEISKIYGKLVQDTISMAGSIAKFATGANTSKEAFENMLSFTKTMMEKINGLISFIDRHPDLIMAMLSPSVAIGSALGYKVRDQIDDANKETQRQTGGLYLHSMSVMSGMRRSNVSPSERMPDGRLIKDILTRTPGETEETAAKKNQLGELLQANEKRREQIALMVKINKLENELSLISARRGDVNEELRKLILISEVKKDIAELELSTAKETERSALSFRNKQTDPIERAQAEGKLLEATSNRINAENKIHDVLMDNERTLTEFKVQNAEKLQTYGIIPTYRAASTLTRSGPPSPGMAIPQDTPVESIGKNIGSVKRDLSEVNSLLDLLEAKLDKAPTDEIKLAIKKAKVESLDLSETLLKNLITLRDIALLEANPNDPQSLERLEQINSEIGSVLVNMERLTPHVMTVGEAFKNTFEIAVERMSAFDSIIGKATGSMAILGRSILDLQKIKDSTGAEAGSVLGGLKVIGGAFRRSPKLPAGSQGPEIPGKGAAAGLGAALQGAGAAIGIASAAIQVVSVLRDVFTAAAKKMAESIKKEVQSIVAETAVSGKIADGLARLELQKIKALSELSGKKGGQKELTTVLQEINSQMEELRTKQKAIIDDFRTALMKLTQGEPFNSIFDTMDAAQKKVEEFIKAVPAATEDAEGQVALFLELKMKKMTDSVQSRIKDLYESWVHGAENAAGELISIDQDAVDKFNEENEGFLKSETARQKSLADLKKNYAKQEAEDIKHLAELKQQLIDLDDEQAKGILDIQNEGIAERQKTTGEDKRQRIADLQDDVKKQHDGIIEQINDLEDVRAERYVAHQEQLAQAIEIEAEALLNHNNTISRIINQTERKRAAFLENMENLQKEAEFIKNMTDQQSAFLDKWLAIYRGLPPPTSGTVVSVGEIIININEPHMQTDQIADMVTGALDKFASNLPLGTSH